MKTSSVSFPVCSVAPAGGPVSVCRGLRSSLTDGEPALVAAPGFDRTYPLPLCPLATATLSSGLSATLLKATDPSALYVDSGGTLTAISEDMPDAFCAVADPDADGWLVMTAGGQMRVTLSPDSGLWNCCILSAAPPVIIITAEDAGSVSALTSPLTLTDVDLSRTAPSMSDSSLDRLTDTLTGAYASLCRQADEAGALLQPAVASVRFYDASGRVIYSSDPVIVGNGWQCCAPISVSVSKPSDSSLLIPAITLSASLYRPVMQIRSYGAFEGMVASARLVISPQANPLAAKTYADYRIVRPAQQEPTLTVALPGVTASLADNSAARTPLITALISSLLSPESGSLPEPHRFIARSVTVAGDAVAWADITPVPALPAIPLADIDPDSSIREWTGTLRLTLADESVRLAPIGYPMPRPMAMPPLVCYPDADAVSLEIWTEDIASGAILYGHAPLSPLSGSRYAFHLMPSLAPSALTSWTGIYPHVADGSLATATRRRSDIISAAASAPLEPLGSVRLPGPVVALHPSVKSQSSWDFSRIRLYAFSPSGIFAVALSADRRSLKASLIDPRPVGSSSLTAYTSSGVMALTPSGQLLCVAASRATAVASGLKASAIGWNAPADNLMLLAPDGSVSVIDLFSRSHPLHTLPASFSHLHACNPNALILTDTLLSYSPAAKPSDTDILWECRIALPSGRRRPLFLRVAMSAACFSGSLTLLADCGATELQAPILRYDIDGEINAPLTARILAPPLPFFTLRIQGHTSPDFRLTSATLHYRQ